jgi:exodeoxyribonuclease V alpha subunit
VRAGVTFVLAQALDEGHCGLPRATVIDETRRQLEVDEGLVGEALRLELAAGIVTADTVGGESLVFLAALHAAERGIAARLGHLRRGLPPWPPIDVDKALPWIEARLSVTLAAGQRAALRQALTSKVLVITGGPGVGKTTLLRAILRVLTAKGVRPLLAAPTGRAAKRMADSTGFDAKTIHRLLEVDPRTGGFRRDERHPLDADLVVIDEASMVDVPLMHAVTRALPDRAALLLVGDVDQLPSVGPGQVLADVIGSRAVPVVELTEIFRQAARSWIVRAAHRINEGLMPEWPDTPEGDCFFVDAADPEESARRILQVVRERIPQRFGLDPVRDVQVLCPMNRGGVGARALNAALQQVLNPGAEPFIERFGWRFSVGDKVMQVENDYDKDVYNGDLGTISRIDADAGLLGVDFEGRTVEYEAGELDRLTLAYATTIHKAQGSEYPAVVVPITTQHYPMLQRKLLYTAVTRGRRLVVLVGQRKALAIAVRGTQERRRWSKLGEWLGHAAV